MNIKSKTVKYLILIVSFLFILFLYLFDFNPSQQQMDSIPVGIETLILLVFGIYFFYEQFKDPTTFYIYYHYCFWVTIGILIYLCGSFFIFMYANKMTNEQVAQFWFFTYIVEIIKNILFTVAIIIYSRKTVDKPPKTDIPYLDINELE
jgi:hypothetical protein